MLPLNDKSFLKKLESLQVVYNDSLGKMKYLDIENFDVKYKISLPAVDAKLEFEATPDDQLSTQQLLDLFKVTVTLLSPGVELKARDLEFFKNVAARFEGVYQEALKRAGDDGDIYVHGLEVESGDADFLSTSKATCEYLRNCLGYNAVANVTYLSPRVPGLPEWSVYENNWRKYCLIAYDSNGMCSVFMMSNSWMDRIGVLGADHNYHHDGGILPKRFNSTFSALRDVNLSTPPTCFTEGVKVKEGTAVEENEGWKDCLEKGRYRKDGTLPYLIGAWRYRVLSRKEQY